MKLKTLTIATVTLAILAGCSNGEQVIAPATKSALSTNANINTQPVGQYANIQSKQGLFDIAKAVAIAETKTGGRAVNLEVQGLIAHSATASAMVYTIETISTTHEYQVWIDARTGEVLSIQKEYDLNVLPNVKLSLADALTIAQNLGKGVVREISLDHEITGAKYEVDIIGDYPYQILIDASNGAILKSQVKYDD
ncbi:PepSY domain-containing protein [Moraxella nasovis]|uniref:PepSY domain-containing protein n=1 Tax=Moraxella nasovis TaxID=2904121 RepID=UPI001F618F7E|nr:PepSY domain-containing protein [Moraxella nasovis]UNU73480.1 PepSY domain-containing protein [Moraxella nasovis]